MERYQRNHDTLMRGAARLGLEAYLRPEDRSCIITTFRYPSGSGFDFTRFYQALSDRGFIIYPGKLTTEPCFRIGTIGRIQKILRPLLEAMRSVLEAMEAVPQQIA